MVNFRPIIPTNFTDVTGDIAQYAALLNQPTGIEKVSKRLDDYIDRNAISNALKGIYNSPGLVSRAALAEIDKIRRNNLLNELEQKRFELNQENFNLSKEQFEHLKKQQELLQEQNKVIGSHLANQLGDKALAQYINENGIPKEVLNTMLNIFKDKINHDQQIKMFNIAQNLANLERRAQDEIKNFILKNMPLPFEIQKVVDPEATKELQTKAIKDLNNSISNWVLNDKRYNSEVLRKFYELYPQYNPNKNQNQNFPSLATNNMKRNQNFKDFKAQMDQERSELLKAYNEALDQINKLEVKKEVPVIKPIDEQISELLKVYESLGNIEDPRIRNAAMNEIYNRFNILTEIQNNKNSNLQIERLLKRIESLEKKLNQYEKK